MRRRRIKPKGGSRGQSESFVLDQFSQANLQQWNKHSRALDEYHIRLFYHLEGLRESHKEQLIKALFSSRSKPVKADSWYRLVSFRYSNDFLSSKGSLISGGRFNIGSDLDSRTFPIFPALYLAENQETAYAENFGAVKSVSSGRIAGHEFALQGESSFTMVRLSFRFENIFDLTKTANLKAFSNAIAKFKMTPELVGLGRTIGLSQTSMLIRDPALLKKDSPSSGWRY